MTEMGPILSATKNACLTGGRTVTPNPGVAPGSLQGGIGELRKAPQVLPGCSPGAPPLCVGRDLGPYVRPT